MKPKYARQIQKFAKKSLKKSLLKMLHPYLDYVPCRVLASFDKNFNGYSLPSEDSLGAKDQLGSKLQAIGKELGEKVAPDYFPKIFPDIEKELDRERESINQSEDGFDKCLAEMDALRERIENKHVVRLIRKNYKGEEVPIQPTPWNAIDVVIHHDPLFLQKSGESIKVLTGDEWSAWQLSCLFQDIWRAFYFISDLTDSRHHFELIPPIGKLAKRSMALGDDWQECQCIVWEKAKSIMESWREDLDQRLEEKIKHLSEVDGWLTEKKKMGI